MSGSAPVLVHDRVPTHQHRLRLARPFTGRFYPRDEGLKVLGRERQMVGLHCGRRLETVPVDRVEELLNAARAEILLPVAPKCGFGVDRDIGVVGVEREADFRVVQLGQLIERDRADPVEGAGRAVCGGQSVAGLAHGNEAGTEEADVAGDIGIDDILRRGLVEFQSVEELAPVARRIEAHHRLRGRVVVAKAGKGEGDRLSGLGDAREIRADVGEHRTVPGRPDRELDVCSVFHMDRLFSRYRTPWGRRASDISTDRWDRPSR